MKGFVLLAAVAIPTTGVGCGLDWTLPGSHFEGVEEHGYVAYWEKIGEVDLGDKLVIPVNINFNSHREASSPTLGKGWMIALLESHVEPIDENSLNVIMPDGWTFLFYRNPNTETWRGNAGWAGETNGTIFTISAPCGWSIKFDQGKIQQIAGGNRTLTYRYNGGVATEVDDGANVLVKVENNLATGVPADIVMGGQKIDLTLARRPQVVTKLNQNLIVGFDQALNSLQWPDGKSETFSFGTDNDLCPTLAISARDRPAWNFTWDPASRQIKSDGKWAYQIRQIRDHLRFDRLLPDGQSESFESDDASGLTIEKALGGHELATYRFPGGPLAGRIRKVEDLENGSRKLLYSASYYPSGRLLREAFYPDKVRLYSATGKLQKETIGNNVDYQQDFDDKGRVTHLVDPTQQLEVKRTFDLQGGQVTQVFKNGALFYTEQIDPNNKLVSINEGDKP